MVPTLVTTWAVGEAVRGPGGQAHRRGAPAAGVYRRRRRGAAALRVRSPDLDEAYRQQREVLVRQLILRGEQLRDAASAPARDRIEVLTDGVAQAVVDLAAAWGTAGRPESEVVAGPYAQVADLAHPDEQDGPRRVVLELGQQVGWAVLDELAAHDLDLALQVEIMLQDRHSPVQRAVWWPVALAVEDVRSLPPGERQGAYDRLRGQVDALMDSLRAVVAGGGRGEAGPSAVRSGAHPRAGAWAPFGESGSGTPSATSSDESRLGTPSARRRPTRAGPLRRRPSGARPFRPLRCCLRRSRCCLRRSRCCLRRSRRCLRRFRWISCRTSRPGSRSRQESPNSCWSGSEESLHRLPSGRTARSRRRSPSSRRSAKYCPPRAETC